MFSAEGCASLSGNVRIVGKSIIFQYIYRRVTANNSSTQSIYCFIVVHCLLFVANYNKLTGSVIRSSTCGTRLAVCVYSTSQLWHEQTAV